MTPPLECPRGHRYWPNQGWIHEKCAAPSAVRHLTGATNTATNAANSSAGGEKGVVGDRTANRRLRADYNEYQRKLMRDRRAKEREKRAAAARAGLEAST